MAAVQSVEDGEGKGGSQSVLRPVYRAHYKTRAMSLAFARQVWGLYVASIVNYFV